MANLRLTIGDLVLIEYVLQAFAAQADTMGDVDAQLKDRVTWLADYLAHHIPKEAKDTNPFPAMEGLH
jgi:hypothetical protein